MRFRGRFRIWGRRLQHFRLVTALDSPAAWPGCRNPAFAKGGSMNGGGSESLFVLCSTAVNKEQIKSHKGRKTEKEDWNRTVQLCIHTPTHEPFPKPRSPNELLEHTPLKLYTRQSVLLVPGACTHAISPLGMIPWHNKHI